jgi:hypothetical protein
MGSLPCVPLSSWRQEWHYPCFQGVYGNARRGVGYVWFSTRHSSDTVPALAACGSDRGGLRSVRQGKRRMAELEKEVAQARAAQAVLQQRVDLFEKIAAAAGASLRQASPESSRLSSNGPVVSGPGTAGLDADGPNAGGPGAGGPGGGGLHAGASGADALGEPLPATLLAAATRGQAAGSPVRLVVGGQDVIAVVGDDEGGDPREWWNAIHRLTSRLRSAS